MKRLILVLLLVSLLTVPVLAVAPIVNFTADPWIGASPLGVNFTDTSINAPTTWAWWFGDEQYNNAWATQPAGGWSARYGHASTVHPTGDIILSGGWGSSLLNDTWSTGDDGASWIEMNGSAPWSARLKHSMVTLSGGDTVLMGGWGSEGYHNDVWMSTNEGTTWSAQTASAGWNPREGQAVIATSDNTLVLAGGDDENLTYRNDVWISTNEGVTWTEQNSSAGWAARSGHKMVVTPDDTILLFGGVNSSQGFNDTWKSTDKGATWTEVSASGGWTPRTDFAAVAVPNGDIMLMGGQDYSMSYLFADVWVSQNKGATWVQVTPASWSPRQGLSAVATPDGYVVMTGGSDAGGIKSDTWINQVAGSVIQSPYHLFTIMGLYPVMLQAHNLDGTDSIRHNITAGVYTIPHANFNWSQPNPLQPLNVSFHDLSNNTPTGWAWFFGDELYNQSWTLQNSTSPFNWTHYYGASTVLPNGHILVAGGWDGTGPGEFQNNDTWISVNQGQTWSEASVSSGWTARASPILVTLPTGEVVMFTGYQSCGPSLCFYNDVWATADEGSNWSEVTAGAGWSPRASGTGVALHDGTIVLMGGCDSTQCYNDTWKSDNGGLTWTEQTPAAPWQSRTWDASAVTLNDTILLMGGANYGVTASMNDVWASTDKGVTWTEIAPHANWTSRYALGATAQPDDSILIIGGNDGSAIHEAWRSVNHGLTWTNLTNSGDYCAPAAAHGQYLPMPDGSIVSVNGLGYGNIPCYNSYRIQPVGSSDKNPFHNYATGGFYTVSLQAYNSVGLSDIQKLLSLGSFYWLNLTFVNATNNATINVVNVTDSYGGSYTTTDGTNSTQYFAGSVTIYATATGYQPKIASFNLVNDTTAIVALDPTTTPSPFSAQQNTLWTPPQVVFQVLDNNNNPIVGTPVWANAEFTTLPGGMTNALGIFTSAFGLSNSTASTILNQSTSYYGTTDSSGSVVFMMIPVISYNVTARDTNGVNYTLSIMPKDQYYQIRTQNATFENQAISEIAYINNTRNSIFNTSFYEPTNGTIGIMGAEIYDSTGKTAGANCWWALIDNHTTWWDNRTWALGSGLQVINKTVPIVPYQQWQWGCTTT